MKLTNPLHIIGLKGLSEEEIEIKLTSFFALLDCLKSRDEFLKIYARYLGARLLDSTTLNNETEKKLIEKFQLEWGSHLSIDKLKIMLQDIETSKETNQAFQHYLLQSQIRVNIEVNIRVLTQEYWNEPLLAKVQVPKPMVPIKKHFDSYFASKYQGKILTWAMNYGDAEIIASFDKKYTLIVSNIQFAILECFNTQDTYTFGDLQAQLQLIESVLMANLIAMVTKVPLLKKENYSDMVVLFHGAV